MIIWKCFFLFFPENCENSECLGRSSGRHWENLVWRSGLCHWCMVCMPMREAMSLLVRGTVKSLKRRSLFTKAQYSACCSSSLCLSCEFGSGVPWKDFYADDLVIIAESLEECVRRLLTQREAMEEKRLRVNAGKTKIIICGTGLELLQSSGKFPWAVCHTGMGNNSVFCNGCKHSYGCTRNAVGSSPWQRTLITDVHGARELHAPCMADHREKSKSDLTSWRW